MQHLFTDFEEEFANFKAFMAVSRKIIITTHQNPDADALGSSLGLKQYLEKKGHHVSVISPTDHAAFLTCLPLIETVINFERSVKTCTTLIEQADIIFCLDFSALSRIKDMEGLVRSSPASKVLIDHHQAPESFADFVFWNEKAAATCELIFQLIEHLGDVALIDKPTAECLYAGIMTDTGSFRFDSTTPETHRVAGGLIQAGVKINELHRRMFDQNELSRQRLLGHLLAHTLTVLPEFKVSYMVLSAEDLEKYSSNMGDTEGFVNFGLALKNVVMTAIFIERKDHIKLSFRSVEDFSVSAFAREHFNGGGHKNASGGRSELGLQATIDKFLTLLPQYQSELLAVNE